MGNAIEKSKNAIQMWVWVWVRTRKICSMVNATGKLRALDTKNALKQQSNDTQGAVMHSGILSKMTR